MEVVMVATKSQMNFHIWMLKYENISKLTNDSSFAMSHRTGLNFKGRNDLTVGPIFGLDQASTDEDGRPRTVHPSTRPCGRRTEI